MTLQEAVSLIELLGGKEAVKKVLAGREFSPVKYGELTLGRLEAILNKIGGIEGAKAFLRGELEINEKRHIIDCDAVPLLPKGWEVVEHLKGGQFELNLNRIELYLDVEQKSVGIGGHELRKKLERKLILNANVLDYLIGHTYLIPDEWKDKYIFFWGTIYRYSDGRLYVCCLCWNGGEWCRHFSWLGIRWDDDYPALLCK